MVMKLPNLIQYKAHSNPSRGTEYQNTVDLEGKSIYKEEEEIIYFITYLVIQLTESYQFIYNILASQTTLVNYFISDIR